MTPQKFASQFRYSEDKSTKKFIEVNNKFEAFDIHNSLLVTKIISPIIYSSLERAAKNLLIDHNNINMYVHASSEINAMCYNGIDDGFVVILNSALVILLEGKELDFVIGHELGHLLFGHTKEQSFDAAEGMKLSRAKELSVDRVGLVAARDLDASLRAVIKIISGLPDTFLKFNISELIDQLRKFDIDASGMLGQTTHPSFLIRAKALLLFSTSDKYQDLLGNNGKNLSDIDRIIKREVDKYIDKSFNKETIKLKDNFNFWITCFAAISDKSLSKEEQRHITEKYGENKLNKFKSMIKGRSLSEIEALVNKKFLEASDALAKFRPISVNDDIDEIVRDLSVRFKIDNLKEKVLAVFSLN